MFSINKYRQKSYSFLDKQTAEDQSAGLLSRRALPKFIKRLVDFAGQGTGPSQGIYLQTEYKPEKCGHTSTHHVSFDPTTTVVLGSHRIQATGFISTLINQLVSVFYTRKPKNDGLDRSLMEFYWFYTLYLSTT